MGFTPDFKSVKSPNAPHGDDDEDAYGSKTPTPPRCCTPPTGIVLTNSQNQLVRLLQAHGLDRHMGTFIEEEVNFPFKNLNIHFESGLKYQINFFLFCRLISNYF